MTEQIEATHCDRCHGESPNHETWCPTVMGDEAARERVLLKGGTLRRLPDGSWGVSP